MTFKNHACCGHTFAAIDVALALQRKLNLRPEEIQHIDVSTYRAGVEVAHYERPSTPAEVTVIGSRPAPHSWITSPGPNWPRRIEVTAAPTLG